MVRLEPRQQHSQAMIYLSPVIAIILTLLSGLVIFALFGKNPVTALYTFFVLPLTTIYSLTELLVKATPLILIGVGLSIGFRANVWNIGAEGQLTMGAIFGGGLAIWLHDSSSIFLLPGMIVLGAVGGGLYGAVPALLKTRYGVNEILTSLMLTYVATLLLSYLVTGPWRDPGGYNFPESRTFPDAGMMPIILEESRLHFGSILAVMVVIGGWVLMAKTVIGFQLKVVGLAPAAAKHVGFVENKLIWFGLCLGGALAGIAGVSEVAGPIGQLNPSISPGYGFTAIIVAFLGRLHPVGVVFAGLVMALTYIGGETAQIEIGTPAAVTGLFQGILLFFLLASDVLTSYRIRFGRPKVAEGGAS
ncbi:MAG: ABC transporter permease [Alphaproteobacteria bacterium]|jgi:general nucleoside transport system permease protein|nr:ABC transporter permease [Alphaproteobacteria bacterium]MBT4017158.1 ABC transporter permease [Alphaproteobacteria bacterium]MBT4966244.1 ABC transporter permease [Alphaproteobacteria bacterium]MBT5159193.1 ABC transporter permease [Alphaproteobacteria bacterium]MBT5917090.1 ABC transporter permease [Alphaproteobacteria bacterium]